MSLFSLTEVVAARHAVRGFSNLLENLRSGKASRPSLRYIILFRNRPQAVLLHIDQYQELLTRAGHEADGRIAA